MADSVIEIQGKTLKLTNLDKVLYPATGFTKRQVIDYYARIAPALLWLANLAAIELHPSLALAKDVSCPTMMVFDLDPGAPANIVQCCQVAFWLREIFEHFNLQSFPKTSGSKGLQIYVPLNTRTSYDVTKPFARALAQLLEQQHPDAVVSDMKKSIRTGKVFVDWSQNDEHKTTVAVYSLRARERPTVSTPVKWEEVERAFKKKHAGLLLFEAPQVVARAEKMGDLFEPVLKLKQKLPDVRGAGMGEGDAKASEPERIQLAAQAEARPTPAARVQPKKAATKRTGNKAANKFKRKPVARDGKK